MAIFLIKAQDNFNSNPEKDKACYKRGDIVEVFEDTKPCVIPPAPEWIIVKINGITKAQALKYMEMWKSFAGLDSNGLPIMRMERRRRYRIRVDDVPAAIKNQIINNRYVEVTTTQIRNYVRNMETGVDGL